MNENDLYIVMEYKIDNPLKTEIDSLLANWFKDCQIIHFDKFKYKCLYDNKLRKIANIEIINLTVSGKSMNLYN